MVYLLSDGQDLAIVIFKLCYYDRKLWSRFQFTGHDISIICKFVTVNITTLLLFC